jgi:hydroxymethylglutaryl-CoA synthase
MSRRVGIEKIGVYPCSLALSLPALCEARHRRADEICAPMMLDERSLNPPWEDPVTMAVNAVNATLTGDDRDRIELLVVATESGVDYEKPISTWVQRYAGVSANCRNFEVKHACYGGTAGLQMAAAWLASSAPDGAKALVVTTDQSRPHFGKPWEFVLGAGAAAILLSSEPAMLELELGRSGYWTNEIADLTRPTSTIETGNSETSLVSYLEALEGAYQHFVSRVPEARRFDDYFQRHVYHMPFGGMAWRAHKTMLRSAAEVSTKDAWANFERKGLAALRYARRMGATYSSSTFIGLLGLIDGAVDLEPGERVSVFSYGSGCCAEFYSARIGPNARPSAEAAALQSRLDARRSVSVEDYEAIERQRAQWVDCGDYDVPRDSLGDWYERFYHGRRLLVFDGMSEFYRQYTWS